MHLSCKDIARFRRKVSAGRSAQCWEWRASCFRSRMGYGAFGVGKRVHAAHRVSFTIHKGRIPKGKCVLHTCDNPKCVNPGHLFLGTYRDNNLDMRLKGRAARKLCAECVRAIRCSNLSSRKLAKLHGVSQHMIMRVIHRIAWDHVP
jgi:hypothetical protein